MATDEPPAAATWRAALQQWGIPDEILNDAPECPWQWPRSRFVRSPDQHDTPSRQHALAALPPGGTVLDVGVGAGWAGLALVPPAERLVGVDPDRGMLDAFKDAVGQRDVDHRAVLGSWPEVSPEVEVADVAVSHHVLYNIPDLEAFATALTDHANHRVVIEITATHPASWLTPLWRHFHDVHRPGRPTADDAARVIAQLGLEPHVQHWSRSPWTRPVSRDEVVELARRMLCLPAEYDSEIDRLLEPEPGSRRFTTIWWDPPEGTPHP